MEEIILEKKRVRSEILRRRAEIPLEKIEDDSRIIINKLKELEAYKRAGTIMCFVDFKKEVITRQLLRYSLEIGKRVLVPLTLRDRDGKLTMKACELLDMEEDLAPGTMGILEPKLDKRRFTEPSEIDFFVVPGLAFDIRKNRLGYGAGLHDVMLRQIRKDCETVAVCFDFQVFDRIPVMEYDVPVKMILTELRTIK